ncbi:hypothetical protein RYX36_021240 [Vicia faba]
MIVHRVSENPPPPPSPIKLPEFENNLVLEELNCESINKIKTLVENNVTETIDKDSLGARMVLKFNFVDDEIDEKFTEKTTKEFGDTKTDESNVSFDDNDGFAMDVDVEPRCPSEEMTNKIKKVVVSVPVNAFRAPVDDTQDLFFDSEMSDIKEEAVNEKLSNPSKEVFSPPMLAMNLPLDFAPIYDDVYMFRHFFFCFLHI